MQTSCSSVLKVASRGRVNQFKITATTKQLILISHSHNAFVAGNFVNGAETAALRITKAQLPEETQVIVMDIK